jgi:hypothetical protein
VRDLGRDEVGEIPNFSEDEPLLSARIGASFLIISPCLSRRLQVRISGFHRVGDQF